MNDFKGRQSEGYDFYDYREMNFNAPGGAEAPYVAGNASNVAVAGSWPSETGRYVTTLLTANVAIGAVNLPVGNPAGFVVGQIVYIVDAANIMRNTVAAVAGLVITVTTPLTAAFTLANGALVTNALPADTQNTMFYSDQNCLVRLLNKAALYQKILGTIPAGAFVQILIPAGQYVTMPNKWIALFAIGQANAGTLRIWASG